MQRATRVLTLSMLGVLLLLPIVGRADDSRLKLEGVVDVPPTGPGGSLTLPLAPASPPVTLLLNFGLPTVQLSVTVNTATVIKSEKPLPVTIGDGDRVRVELVIMGGGFVATKLEVREFPEIKLSGTAHGLPTGGVTLPLAAGSPPVDFTLNLGVVGADVPVRATGDTKVEDGPLTVMNGDSITIEGFVLNMRIVITEIQGPEGEGEGGDED